MGNSVALHHFVGLIQRHVGLGRFQTRADMTKIALVCSVTKNAPMCDQAQSGLGLTVTLYAQDRIGLFCYKKCANVRPGTKRFGFDCHSVCPRSHWFVLLQKMRQCATRHKAVWV